MSSVEVAGDGCSGGPVVIAQPNGLWQVAGVYIGSGDVGASVGDSVRCEEFYGWVPQLFQKSVCDESLDL